MTALVIDDEKPSRDLVNYFLEKQPLVTVIGECDNGVSAVNSINMLAPDVVFLDIQMPDLTGFEVLNWLDLAKKPIVIFVTAFDNYALQAFNAHAVDYLLKPFSEDRFNLAVNKALHFLKNEEEKQPILDFEKLSDTYNTLRDADLKTPKYAHQLIVKDRKRLLIVKITTILYITAADDFVEIHTSDNKKHLYDERLHKLEQTLDPARFVRIHRSHIVNVDSIVALRPYQNGEYFVDLQNGTTLKLSRTYKDILSRLTLNTPSVF